MRITAKVLKEQVQTLNKVAGFDGNPEFSTIGAYTLSQAYGGYALHKWVNEHGGISDLTGGHGTARETYDAINKVLAKQL
jgi:hypothetical protein